MGKGIDEKLGKKDGQRKQIIAAFSNMTKNGIICLKADERRLAIIQN